MLGGQGKSSFLDAVAHGGNPQDRAASLKTQSSTTNRCVNPGKSQLERKMVRWGTPEPGEKEGKRTF
ncbi:hypothetical protein [Moorena sp. SIO4G3]|uniref:hypothetical protein n=1 Tax=Moorena sp. SIO4G3 TaxID=2607821 RepID=UPI0025CEBF15|nr:hypothetical protein [Moorena sp. SIO4G3]